MRKTISIITIAMGLLAGLIWGCSDKGNEPDLTPVRENVYISATDWTDYEDSDSRVDQVYVFDADSLHLLDSIPLASPAIDIEVSADGQFLYIWRTMYSRTPGATEKIDARTGDVIWSRPYYPGELNILQNEELLLQGDLLIDPADGREVGRVPDSLIVPDGHPGPRDGTEIVVIAPGEPRGVVRRLNVLSGEIYGSWVPHLPDGTPLAIFGATLHPNGRHVLTLGVRSILADAWVAIGDLQTGETVGSFRTGNPYGEIVICPDRSRAVVTGPAHPTGQFPTMLHMINLESLTRSAVVDAISGQARFASNLRKIIAGPSSSLMTAGPIQLLDLATLKVDTTVWLGRGDPLTGGMAIGPRPEQ